MKKARVPRGVRKLRGCITCGIDKTLTQEQWDEHEAKFHLGLFQSILLLISAELKPRGYYPCVLFGFGFGLLVFLMRHLSYLDRVEFYVSHVLTKFTKIIVGKALCTKNQSHKYF